MKISIILDKENKSVTIIGNDLIDTKTHTSYKIKGQERRWIAGLHTSAVTVSNGWVLKRNTKHSKITRIFLDNKKARVWANNAALALKEFYKDIK